MMAAEKWYEYQEDYKRYGIDMKPRLEKTEKTKPESTLKISANDKARLLLLTIIVGIVGLAVIVASAYAAELKYDINTIIAENDVLADEIETINVQLMWSTNIQTIETKAMTELGMVYPQAGQYVFIADSAKPGGDFAILLKEQAYN